MKQWLPYARGLLVAASCMTAALVGLGWLARPDVQAKPPAYTSEQLADAEAARNVRFDPNDTSQLPVLHVDVDYAQGNAARWWPKNEPPILRELVGESALPPVQVRTGPEPCVMRGVDGIGTYGGTWHRIATHDEDIDIIRWRLSSTGLVRWSPLGYPIKPHLAKRVEALRDNREFVVHLREGVRWSDGQPFTVDDILYWWDEERDPIAGYGVTPKWMRSAGKPARLEKIDELTLRIAFDEPHGSFMEHLASSSHLMVQSPKHFLSKYHPIQGDQGFIEREMRAFRMPGKRALYTYVKNFANPEHPRL